MQLIFVVVVVQRCNKQKAKQNRGRIRLKGNLELSLFLLDPFLNVNIANKSGKAQPLSTTGVPEHIRAEPEPERSQN